MCQCLRLTDIETRLDEHNDILLIFFCGRARDACACAVPVRGGGFFIRVSLVLVCLTQETETCTADRTRTIVAGDVRRVARVSCVGC